jgi:hypothetical protein
MIISTIHHLLLLKDKQKLDLRKFLYLRHMLDFATVRRFTAGKLTVAQVTFSLNRFTFSPFLAFTFIAAFTIREFIHQLTPFDLDPSPAFN